MNTADSQFSNRWVLPISIFLLLVPLAAIELPVLDYTKGIWPYPLDDAYIHMAIAKNLAVHHIWSATGHGFQSASSSILYPLLLASVYDIFGVHSVIPFLINLAAGIILLYTMQRWLQKQGIPPFQQLIILTLVDYLTPLPVMIAIGMEHTLQVLFCFLFIYSFCDWLANNDSQSRKAPAMPWNICLWGLLVTTIRFEGLFLILIACVFLVWKRRPLPAAILLVITSLPLLFFGIYSVNKGSYFLPNSVLLKSSDLPRHLSDLPGFLSNGIFEKIYFSSPTRSQVATVQLLVILPLAYLFFFNKNREPANTRYIVGFLIMTVLLHLCFASTIWFFRYEAYLIASSVLIIGMLISKIPGGTVPGIKTVVGLIGRGLVLFLVIPLLLRAWTAISVTSPACHDIYNQNYQMGEFLHRYYDSTTIAINDLGAVSYLTEGNNLDLWGLANILIARSKRGNYYTPAFLDSMVKTEKVKIAVVFDRLYSPWLLDQWKKVATWHIDVRTIAGDFDLNFYAVDTLLAKNLEKNLRTYQAQLPSEVSVLYYGHGVK